MTPSRSPSANFVGAVVLDNPAHATLAERDLLIPFVDEFVGEIDDEANVILVKLIPGMFA